jgi:DNA-binding response OmpR family regulator
VEEKDDTTPSVLIVEDDADMLSFLSSHFARHYTVFTATNGHEGLSMLRTHAVSLIVSDWMMPEMDGAEFCQRVRADRDTSHIPLIMLTAKTDDESKAQSMELGADVFIEKPFSMKYLDACIRNLIERRRNLMRRFSEHPEEGIEPLAGNSIDNEFLVRMNQIIEENLGNAELSVNFLAEQLNISRSGLFSKIKALTDVTPNEMIQVVRLKRAAQLLAEGQYRVNEVCYMVGFSSPSYFTKCFQKQFGKKPGEMMKS